MAIKRRGSPAYGIERTRSESAAIAACKAINRDCPCERAPSVCAIMVFAARAAVRAAIPEAAEKFLSDEAAAVMSSNHP